MKQNKSSQNIRKETIVQPHMILQGLIWVPYGTLWAPYGLLMDSMCPPRVPYGPPKGPPMAPYGLCLTP